MFNLGSTFNAPNSVINNVQGDQYNNFTAPSDIGPGIIDYQTSLHLILLNRLRPAEGASHRSEERPACLEDTRVQILHEITEWASDDSTLPIYWLNGVAGTGKTTIAQTFANHAFADGLLGASFFCSRSIADRNNIHNIFPTIAYQLACRFPWFRSALVDVLNSDPDVARFSLSQQVKRLLVEPLQKFCQNDDANTPCIIVVIDALDECTVGEPETNILSVLSNSIRELRFTKFFITSRPESHIRRMFLRPLLWVTKELVLHNVDLDVVNRDIEKYLKASLSKVILDKDLDVVLPWPSQDDLAILVRRASGLFIYVSTTVKFISSKYHHPCSRLEALISQPSSNIHEGRTGIDRLYTDILSHGYQDADSEDVQLFSNVRLIVGVIVLVFNPVSILDITALLCIDKSMATVILDQLHSVLRIPGRGHNAEPISPFHKSFADFITDPTRCRDTRFYINPALHHAKTTICCLKLMQRKLAKNICSIPSHTMNSDVEDLHLRRKQCIGDTLEYACQFWSEHLLCVSNASEVKHITAMLTEIFEKHFLQWIEVLSITHQLGIAIHSLRNVHGWLVKNAPSPALLSLIADSERFVLNFFDLLKESVPFIYESALSWCPSSSLILHHYRKEMTTRWKLVNADSHWNVCIRTIETRVAVVSVAQSRNGSLVAAGGSDGSVRIYENPTGLPLANLEGHAQAVCSIAFSHDDKLLLSGSMDATIKVWDVLTGANEMTFLGHTGLLRCVSQPRDTVVISAGGKTIRIWDLEQGACRGVLELHSAMQSACVSADGDRVLVGFTSGIVQIWDIFANICLKSFESHTMRVIALAYSSDGIKFASASWDGSVKIYNARTYTILNTIYSSGIRSICLSSSGSHLLYTALNSVHVSDLLHRTEPSTFIGHSQWVRSAVFSPDETSVLSGSDDGTLRLWKIGGEVENDAASGSHTSIVTAVRFSADGRRVVSGSDNHTIGIRDTISGSWLQTLGGHIYPARVRLIDISNDYSLVISTVLDGSRLGAALSWRRVFVWNVTSGTCIRQIDMPSESRVLSIQFSPDSDKFACLLSGRIYGKYGNSLDVFSATIGDHLATFQLMAYDDSRQIVFSDDGSEITLPTWAPAERFRIQPADSLPDKSSELPFNLVPLGLRDPEDFHSRLPPYRLSQPNRDWLLDTRGKRICWVPPYYRGDAIACHGHKAAIGSATGRVTILDLSDVESQ